MNLQRGFIPDFLHKYPDLSVSFAGEHKETSTTQSAMRRGAILGLIGIYIILSFQFRSYLEPIVVMIAIPMAFVGVIWGHILMGLDLTLPSMMGFVSLAGIVVNDSILLVAFIKKHTALDMAVEQAVSLASRDRFRAIVLTSLTTIAGLLPLLTERSLQAQILIPLATSIVFGLLASTLLVLIVIPALYTILADFGLTAHCPNGVSDSRPTRR